MLKDFAEKLTVIFLLDAQQPHKVVLLQRGSERKFAPNFWTGLGGKIELEKDSDQLAGAERELSEETKGAIRVPLHEFARVNINNLKILCYFWGIYQTEDLPACTEGTLHWVSLADTLSKDIIPTTKFPVT